MPNQSLVAINQGGTNAISMATSTGIVKYDGTSLVTSTAVIDSTNRLINTSQPCFEAYVNTSITDITGDATVYTVIFDTEVYDIGSNFNLATSVFTAPVTGKYLFHFGCLLGGGTLISAASLRITTTARTYQRSIGNSSGSTTSSTGEITQICAMTAADTASFQVLATDSGGKIDDVSGVSGGLIRTYCSGALLF